MWKPEKTDIGEQFADAFCLPKDMVTGATLLHMIGRTEIFLENYKGLLAYTCDEIIVKGCDGKICICGKCLVIDYYSNEDMRVSGQIQEVRLIKGV